MENLYRSRVEMLLWQTRCAAAHKTAQACEGFFLPPKPLTTNSLIEDLYSVRL